MVNMPGLLYNPYMEQPKKKRKTKAQKEQAHRLRVLVVVLMLAAVIALILIYSNHTALRDAFMSVSAPDIDISLNAPADIPAPSPMPEQPYLDLYFFDVGQGDSALLISPSGKTMLIDAGDAEHVLKLSLLLGKLNIKRIDALVATHPHNDHIGGMRQIIKTYDIGAFYMPDAEHTTSAYEGMISALWDKGISSTVLASGTGDTISWDDDVLIEVLSPYKNNGFSDLNDQSLMLKFTYAGRTLLFTGDAGLEAEETAVNIAGVDAFKADILKVPHHGSEWASPKFFIDAVQPKAAVISCGKNNDYGHPEAAVLGLLNDCNASVYRTDENGTVRAVVTPTDILIASVSRGD